MEPSAMSVMRLLACEPSAFTPAGLRAFGVWVPAGLRAFGENPV
jgi:hypothetical protein